MVRLSDCWVLKWCIDALGFVASGRLTWHVLVFLSFGQQAKLVLQFSWNVDLIKLWYTVILSCVFLILHIYTCVCWGRRNCNLLYSQWNHPIFACLVHFNRLPSIFSVICGSVVHANVVTTRSCDFFISRNLILNESKRLCLKTAIHTCFSNLHHNVVLLQPTLCLTSWNLAVFTRAPICCCCNSWREELGFETACIECG